MSGIERSVDVCDGDARIAGTRIPVWVLVQAKNLGMSDADILKNHPSLNAKDIENAWAYAATHQAEINADIRANEEA